MIILAFFRNNRKFNRKYYIKNIIFFSKILHKNRYKFNNRVHLAMNFLLNECIYIHIRNYNYESNTMSQFCTSMLKNYTHNIIKQLWTRTFTSFLMFHPTFHFYANKVNNCRNEKAYAFKANFSLRIRFISRPRFVSDTCIQQSQQFYSLCPDSCKFQ